MLQYVAVRCSVDSNAHVCMLLCDFYVCSFRCVFSECVISMSDFYLCYFRLV